ncbi:MAG: MFS transporter [Rhizomicrobium sp.]|jgi:MFS family permease
MSEPVLNEEPTRRVAAASTVIGHDRVLHVTSPEERRRAFVILFGSMICLGAGQSVMFAVLPSFARKMGLTEFEASLPFVTSATIWVFSSGYWGKKSDSWGRRPIILLGLVAFGISFGLFAMVASVGIAGWLPVMVAYPLMIAARSIYGIFGSGAAPAAQAYVVDRTTREERTRGVAGINAAFGLGTAVGPAIGSILAVLGLFVPFYFTAAVALASAATIWFLLPERSAPKLKLDRAQPLHWHDRRVWPFIVFGVGISTVGAIPIQTVGYLFIDVLHLTPEVAPQYIGVGLFASSVAGLFAQVVIVQLLKMSARALIYWGSAIALMSNLLFAVGHQFGSLVFALIMSGVGFGMVRPGYAAAASLAVDPHEQGAVAGLTGATGATGFIFAPMIATALYRVSPAAPYIFGTSMMVALYAYALLSPHLRNAGQIASGTEAANEAPETQVPNG